MKMLNLRRREFAEAALLVLPVLFVAAVWERLPDAVPMHWSFRGDVDRWGAPWTLLLLPLLSVGMWLLLLLAPSLDPRIRRAPEAHKRTRFVLRLTRLGGVLLLTLLSVLITCVALGAQIDVARIALCALLVLCVAVGNYLPSVKPNYFVGIRTPWTLDGAGTWQATHRLGGRILFFGGLMLIAVESLLPVALLTITFSIYIGAFAIWCLAYSFLHNRRSQSVRDNC